MNLEPRQFLACHLAEARVAKGGCVGVAPYVDDQGLRRLERSHATPQTAADVQRHETRLHHLQAFGIVVGRYWNLATFVERAADRLLSHVEQNLAVSRFEAGLCFLEHEGPIPDDAIASTRGIARVPQIDVADREPPAFGRLQQAADRTKSTAALAAEFLALE